MKTCVKTCLFLAAGALWAQSGFTPGVKPFIAVDAPVMALEHVRPVEALLGSGPGPRTEATDHGTLIMGQRVPIFIIFPGETFDVIIARGDWALLRPLILVGEHMRLQILKDLAAFWVGTSSFFT